MATLKEQLHADQVAATRAQDVVVRDTLRMALTSVKNEEVAGKEARELSDAEVITVLTKEGKKRREAIEAYTQANRPDLADKEAAELAVLERYLPTPLTEAELAKLIADAVDAAKANGLEGMKAMGAVMKTLQPQINGRADGGAVSTAVKAALGQ